MRYTNLFSQLFLTVFFLSVQSFSGKAQLILNTSQTAQDLANIIAGNGVAVTNASLVCPTGAFASFSNGATTNINLQSGVLLTSGQAVNALGPNTTGNAGTDNGAPGDATLSALVGEATFDACVLQFDFVPASNQISFNYVFGSEEYPEFVNSNFNDVFGFFITGPNPGGGNYAQQNIAIVPGTPGIPVSINNVNQFSYNQYYIGNIGGQTIQYDGFTTVLAATAAVVPCSTYTLKLGVADVFDGIYDSGVFLQENSLVSGGPLSAVIPNASVTPQVCNTPGSATVNATGGIPSSYTYSWNTNPVQTTQTATGLNAGTYTVTVSSFDCVNITSAQATVVIPYVSPLTATTAVTNVTCNGLANGTATVNPVNGTGPYQYTWLPGGQITQTASGLAPGTYTVGILDANGCAATATANVAQPLTLTSNASASNVLCNGGSTGSAQVSASGGTSPYSYSWSPSGGTNPIAGVLSAGTYTVTVTDANNCTSTSTVTVNQPPALSISVNNVVNPLCFGNLTGAATATASGGTGSYTYAWSPSGGNQATASGLGANTYTVTATDQNNCQTNTTVLITQPTQLSVSIPTHTNVLCFGGNTGTASASALGGTGSYSYVWTPTGGNQSAATGLSSGNYTVTVTDVNNCTATASQLITQPTLLTATSGGVNASCNGSSTGSVNVVAGGGTTPYSYLWSNNVSGNTQANIPAGTYSVAVTDGNGCTTGDTVTIGQPTVLVVTPGSLTPVTCNGGSNGSASVNASGGPGGYTYLWQPGNQSNSTATGLAAGTYSVTVSDAGNCDTITLNVTITQPPALVVQASASNPSFCNGFSSDLLASGALNYAWTPNTGLSSSTGSVVTATPSTSVQYVVTGSDANGCIGSDTVSLTVFPKPQASGKISVNPACLGTIQNFSDQSSQVSPPDVITQYTWDFNGDGINEYTGNQSLQTYTAPSPGNYTAIFIVSTNNGCLDTTSINYTINPLPVADFQISAACQSLPSSFLNLSSVSSGSITTYAWNFGDGSPANNQADPSYQYPDSGSFTVSLIVTTAAGCSDTTSKDITIVPNPVVDFSYSTGCFNTVTVTGENISGDVVNWSWELGNGTSADTSVYAYSYTQPGTYTVILTGTNAGGCTGTTQQDITVTATTDIQNLIVPNIITPNGDGINDELTLDSQFSECQDYSIRIYNRWGNMVYSYTKGQTPFDGQTQLGAGLSNGVYFYIIRSGNVEKNGTLTVAAAK